MGDLALRESEDKLFMILIIVQGGWSTLISFNLAFVLHVVFVIVSIFFVPIVVVRIINNGGFLIRLRQGRQIDLLVGVKAVVPCVSVDDDAAVHLCRLG